MRTSVIGGGDATRDPHVRALVTSLVWAGHDVSVVTGGSGPGGLPRGVDVIRTSSDPGALSRIAGRVRGPKDPGAERTRRLLAGARRARPDLIYPVSMSEIPVAAAVPGAAVVRRPEWPTPERGDLVELAPHDARWSTSPAGPGSSFHTANDHRSGHRPVEGRHDGVTVAVATRVTPTGPARYLVAALERAGVETIVLDGAIDWDRIPEHTAAVVVVESPYPALDVRGLRGSPPVLFWVHHGEHHLMANLRLAARYDADAILLAHSWHLAHRFPVPVHRFPFAVAPEVFRRSTPWDDRTIDVAMVAAGLEEGGARYGRRYEMAQRLRTHRPGRTAFTYGVLPEDMAALYDDTRVVLNDGGTRHHPITMRVFEAIGSGALLLTESLPGMDLLLEPGGHFLTIQDDLESQVDTVLRDPVSADLAAAAHRHARDHHTYDHRVDELLAIAAATERTTITPLSPSDEGGIADLVAADVEVQTIAALGSVDLGLPDRSIRTGDDPRLRLDPGRTDAVVLGPGHGVDLVEAVTAARRYVYATESERDTVRDAVLAVHPDARIEERGGSLRADLRAPGYRMRPSDHPLAGRAE